MHSHPRQLRIGIILKCSITFKPLIVVKWGFSGITCLVWAFRASVVNMIAASCPAALVRQGNHYSFSCGTQCDC